MSPSKWIGLSLIVMAFGACTKEETTNTKITDPNPTNNESVASQSSLVFMLEEEKLARDTYRYLDSLYNLQIFKNIASSEQKHMDMIRTILDAREIEYEVLPEGEFADTALQAIYYAFREQGLVGLNEGFTIGATIEDLDIYDLQNFIAESEDSTMIETYYILICGSGNHLRGFVSNLEQNGGSYSAQFLSQAEVDSILAGSHTHCN